MCSCPIPLADPARPADDEDVPLRPSAAEERSARATQARNVRAVVATAVLAILLLLLAAVVTGPRDEVRAQGAQADYFLKIPGIEGESTHELHRGEIEVESWSWGETNSTATYGAGAGTGKVRINDFNFSMKVSKASPKLMLYCALGRIVPSATLTAVGPDGTEFLKYELKNVVISSYKTSGERSTGPPTEEIRLRFSQIILTHTTQNADGTTSVQKVGYDLAKGKSV